MRRIVLSVLIPLLILISACNAKPSATINPEVLVTPTLPGEPEVDKATIVGKVMHEQGYPMIHTIVHLAEVARGAEGKGGAYILDMARSPATFTDESGYFNIQNVKAGEYVIVVGDVEITAVYQIIAETNGSAKIWNLPANQVTDIGTLTVNIIPPTPNPTGIPGQYPAPTAYPNP